MKEKEAIERDLWELHTMEFPIIDFKIILKIVVYGDKNQD